MIALDLLVDDPVPANDAIKREIANGLSPLAASWIRFTRIQTAIISAAAMNVLACLSFLLLTGSSLEFIEMGICITHTATRFSISATQAESVGEGWMKASGNRRVSLSKCFSFIGLRKQANTPGVQSAEAFFRSPVPLPRSQY